MIPQNSPSRNNTFEVWKQYEQIAMHFNDLLSKLRLQALAGIGTLSAIVGIFSKDIAATERWEILAFVFLVLGFIWISIWTLDFLYYNRLLIGAVYAVVEVEKKSQQANSPEITEFNMSQRIEQAVLGELPLVQPALTSKQEFKRSRGRWFFYIIILFTLWVCSAMCYYKHCNVKQENNKVLDKQSQTAPNNRIKNNIYNNYNY